MKKVVLKDSQQNPIHIYVYEPETKAKGIMQIIHGASEHFARYGVFAEFMNKNGYVVIGCDMLGHGLSTETYDYVHFADKGGDKLAFESLLLVKDYISEKYKSLHVYLLGHSMGAFLARKLIFDYPNFYQKAIISGDTYVSGMLTSVGILLTGMISFFKGPKCISKLIQNMAMDANPRKMKKDGLIGDFQEAWLTKDEKIQQYYHHSKMCGQPFTVRANQDMFRWMAYINKKANILKGKKDQPILFISGEKDPLSNYGKTVNELVALMKKLGYTNVSFILYENDRHETLNEMDHEKVFDDLLKFIES